MSEQKNGCAKISPLLDPYFEGVLSKSEERRVSEHLWQCPRCAAELEQVRRLAVLLNRAPTALPKAALAAAISARIATLPDPSARRRARGWKRLGLAEVAILSALTSAWCAARLLGPHALRFAQPALHYVSGLGHHLAGWVLATWWAGWHALQTAAEAAPALGQEALRLAPLFARYAGLELILVAGLAFLLRLRRTRSALRQTVPGRRF